MAFTDEIIPTRGLRVNAKPLHFSLFTKHLLGAFNCILTHKCEYRSFYFMSLDTHVCLT